MLPGISISIAIIIIVLNIVRIIALNINSNLNDFDNIIVIPFHHPTICSTTFYSDHRSHVKKGTIYIDHLKHGKRNQPTKRLFLPPPLLVAVASEYSLVSLESAPTARGNGDASFFYVQKVRGWRSSHATAAIEPQETTTRSNKRSQ